MSGLCYEKSWSSRSRSQWEFKSGINVCPLLYYVLNLWTHGCNCQQSWHETSGGMVIFLKLMRSSSDHRGYNPVFHMQRVHNVTEIVVMREHSVWLSVVNCVERKMEDEKTAFQNLKSFGWRVSSVGGASDSRSKDPRFEPCLCQEHTPVLKILESMSEFGGRLWKHEKTQHALYN